MTIESQVFEKIGAIPIPHFFITVEFSSLGNEIPDDMESFLWKKYETIVQGGNGRKFVYKKGEWRMIFTFFPTDSVVDERYALKNKVQMKNK